MIGLMEWVVPEKGKRSVCIRERSFLKTRFVGAEMVRGIRTPEQLLRHRVALTAKRLRKLGITRIVPPEKFLWGDTLEKYGIYPIETRILRQELAADWVRWALEEREIQPVGARVAVCAEQLTGEVVRTVTELVLRHRYVLLDLPHGGEELCRRLRREYGVSLLLGPDKGQLEGAEAVVLFHNRTDLKRENPVVLALYDETAPVPSLFLPSALEDPLPRGVDRLCLLAALREAGVIRPGQITLGAAVQA